MSNIKQLDYFRDLDIHCHNISGVNYLEFGENCPDTILNMSSGRIVNVDNIYFSDTSERIVSGVNIIDFVGDLTEINLNCGLLYNLSAIENNNCVDLIDINTDVQISTSGAMIIPVGDNPEAGSIYEQTGAIRYNENKSSFEGYNGSVWAGLGAIIKLDDTTGEIVGTSKGFSSDVEPTFASTGLYMSGGDIWFDTNNSVIKVYNSNTNSWDIFGSTYL